MSASLIRVDCPQSVVFATLRNVSAIVALTSAGCSANMKADHEIKLDGWISINLHKIAPPNVVPSLYELCSAHRIQPTVENRREPFEL
uniref:ACT domain-containing protein n=1 Tax=Angiostrongylus cantonensis TaxID=6313 RepID=A0A0K0D4H9_ANGCA